MAPFILHLFLHSFQIHLSFPPTLSFFIQISSPPTRSLRLFHPPLFFFSKSSLSLLTICNFILSLPHILSLSLSVLQSARCPSLILSFFPFVGRQQDLPLSGCVSVITCGFTQRAVAKNRGTKAITHSTTHCLLCHIKGKRVIFQLQFAVSCQQLEERCGDVCVCVYL